MVRSMAMTLMALALLLAPNLAYGEEPTQTPASYDFHLQVTYAEEGTAKAEEFRDSMYDLFRHQGASHVVATRCVEQYTRNYVARYVRVKMGQPNEWDLRQGSLVNTDHDCTEEPDTELGQ